MPKLARYVAALCVIALAVWWSMRSGDSTSTAAAPVAQSAPELPPLVALQAPTEAHVMQREEVASKVPAATPTLLSIVCVYDDDRTPIMGLDVSARRREPPESSGVKPESARAKPGETATTDAQGSVELEVESGAEFVVMASSKRLLPTTEFVPALSDGERRKLVLLVPRPKGLEFRGRVVDAQTGAPPAGAFVLAEGQLGTLTITISGRRGGTLGTTPRAIALRDGGAPIDTAPDGTFMVAFGEFEHGMGLASAPGYSPILFPLGPGHEDPANALVVRISRVATLAITVLERAGVPLAEADVVARTGARNVVQREYLLHGSYDAGDPVWVARTDRAGFAELRDVAPGVPLQLVVHSSGREPYEATRTLSLEPGERREHEIVFGGGATLIGRALDEAGKPCVGLTVGCAPAHGDRATLLDENVRGLRTTKTDDQGAFQLENVDDGLWWVGTVDSRRDANAPRALALPVQVAGGSASEIELRVERTLRITGIIVDPEGRAAPHASVFAYFADSSASLFGLSDGEGRFSLGPLPRGRWTLSADAFGSSFARSENFVTEAGAMDVTLRLRRGASISGRVVDPGGGRVSGMVSLGTADTGIGSTSMRGDAFEFSGLLPGDYAVAMSLSDGRCGSTPALHLDAGQALTDVVLSLGRGARITVRNDDGVALVSFEMKVDGFVVKSDGLPAGERAECHVPPGAFELKWTQRPPQDPLKVERAVLAAGDEREFSWKQSP